MPNKRKWKVLDENFRSSAGAKIEDWDKEDNDDEEDNDLEN